MERINLLPDDLTLSPVNRFLFLVDRQFLPTLGRMAGISAVLVGILALGQFLMTQRSIMATAGLKEKCARVAAEVEKMADVMARLDQRESELNRQIRWQNERIGYLRSYQDPSGRWAPVLKEIKRALPFGVWLTELEGNPQRRLQIGGGAFEEDMIVQFMAALKGIPRFRDVSFNFAKKATIGKTGIVQFEIVAKINGATPVAEESTEKRREIPS